MDCDSTASSEASWLSRAGALWNIRVNALLLPLDLVAAISLLAIRRVGHDVRSHSTTFSSDAPLAHSDAVFRAMNAMVWILVVKQRFARHSFLQRLDLGHLER